MPLRALAVIESSLDDQGMLTGGRAQLMGRKARFLVALSVGVGVVAGCGSGMNSNQGVQTLLAGLPSALSAAHSFRITIDGTEQYPGEALSTIHAEGVVDWTTNSADLQVAQGVQSSRVLIVAGAVYLPRSAVASGRAAEWVRFPLGSQGVLSGLDPLGDPLTTLSSLRHQLHRVTSDGTASVGGVPTTELSGQLTKLGNHRRSATVTVWIDHQGRIRQLHLIGSGSGVSVDLTERFSDFGVAVQVAAPPPNEVMSFQQLMNKQQAKMPVPTSLPTPPGGFPTTPGGFPRPSALPQPTGTWAVQASGTTDGISWQLATTTATHHGECLATTTHPPLGQVDTDQSADGTGTSGAAPPADYRGLPANCGPDPIVSQDASGPEEPIVQVLDAESLNQSGAGRHYISGIANPKVTSLAAQLSDGTSVTVEQRHGVFFATWTGHRRLASMTFNYPPNPYITCTTDTGAGYVVTDLSC